MDSMSRSISMALHGLNGLFTNSKLALKRDASLMFKSIARVAQAPVLASTFLMALCMLASPMHGVSGKIANYMYNASWAYPGSIDDLCACAILQFMHI